MKLALSEDMRSDYNANLIYTNFGLHHFFPGPKVALTKELVSIVMFGQILLVQDSLKLQKRTQATAK